MNPLRARPILANRLVLSGIGILIMGGFLLWRNYLSLEPYDGGPDWSPDGQQLVFSCRRRQRDKEWEFLQEYLGPYSGRDGAKWSELCIVDLETSTKQQLTRNSYDDGLPAWSPDGLYIAYRFTASELPDIGLLNLDSVTSINLTNSPDLAEGHPIWSPVDKMLAFIALHQGTLQHELYTLDLNTGETRQITYSQGVTSFTEFAWSPSGRHIVFTAETPEEEEVFIVSIETGAVTQVTFNDGANNNPVWSPDGRLIAFTAGDRRARVYCIDISTLETTQISTDITVLFQSLAWSPDGQYLAYLRDSHTDERRTFLEIKGISPDAEDHSYEIATPAVLELRWSPDGRYVAMSFDDDWNHDGFFELKIWLFDVEYHVLEPLYTTFPWRVLPKQLHSFN